MSIYVTLRIYRLAELFLDTNRLGIVIAFKSRYLALFDLYGPNSEYQSGTAARHSYPA